MYSVIHTVNYIIIIIIIIIITTIVGVITFISINFQYHTLAR